MLLDIKTKYAQGQNISGLLDGYEKCNLEKMAKELNECNQSIAVHPLEKWLNERNNKE